MAGKKNRTKEQPRRLEKEEAQAAPQPEETESTAAEELIEPEADTAPESVPKVEPEAEPQRGKPSGLVFVNVEEDAEVRIDGKIKPLKAGQRRVILELGPDVQELLEAGAIKLC
jgi:hypothetical protein